MKLHRFIGDFDLSEKKIELRESELVHQIRNVLRLKKDSKVVLCDSKTEKQATVQIKSIGKNTIVCNVLNGVLKKNTTVREVTLFCSILKRENFELVVQKATELGVSSIVPIVTDRTIKTGLKRERLERIIKEACEQSGRSLLCHLEQELSFSRALPHALKTYSSVFVCDQSGVQGEQLKKKLNASSLAFFIGPEGGWSEREYVIIKQTKGICVCSLGHYTLRAETAAIVASYLTVNS